jgi:hypothetical protein
MGKATNKSATLKRVYRTQGGDGRGKEEEACVFPKNTHGVIKKTVPAITTTATATPKVTPIPTPEESVKFMRRISRTLPVLLPRRYVVP